MKALTNLLTMDSIRVLMVDDEVDQTKLAELNLKTFDPTLTIDALIHPGQALELLREQQYECVVSDYQMPEMNGVQLCREIRRFSTIPFIIYTGRGSEEVASEAFAAGADDYLRKEKDLSHYRVLAKRIRHSVERHRFEDLYRLSIEDNRDGFALIRGTDFVYANQAMADMLGMVSPGDLVGHSILRWVIEMERDLIKDRALSRQSGAKQPKVYEYRVKRADGEIRTLEASVSLINYLGKPASLVFNHDVTERKSWEEALRESEDRLKRSQEMAHLGSWELDTVKDKLVWSDEVYRIFGFKPKEFGATYEAFLDAVHPEDRATVDAAYSSSLREGKYGYEIVHRIVRRSSGDVRYVHEKCEHVRDEGGRVIRSIGMIQDVTDRQAAENDLKSLNTQLLESNEKLRDSNMELTATVEELQSTQEELKNANEELLSTNDQLKSSREDLQSYANALEATVNERTAAIRRSEEKLRESSLYTRSLIEASLDPLVTISPEGKITDVNEATVQITGASREQLIGSEFSDYFTEPEKAREGYQRVFKEGSVRDYPLTIRYVSGAVTDVLYHATIYRDSSGKVQGVFAAARDITNRRRAEEKLREAEKNAAIGRLTSMLAHDLRNPLNFIIQASELAGRQPDKAERMLKLIRDNALRSLSLVEDLRQVTREVELKREVVDLPSLIRNVAEQAEASGKVTVELGIPNRLDLNVDPSMMRRVLENLVNNAVEAMPTGGRLTIRSRRGKEATQIEVEDTGEGIPEDVIPHLFDPFYSTKPKGMGLGLTFVKRIVEAHGGKLTFKTREGIGTTFVVSVPTR